MANELAASFPGVAVDNASEMPERATHMLLYLCEESWSDDRLAEQVKQVREARLPIVMAHENDTERGGVPFSRFFETTPQGRITNLFSFDTEVIDYVLVTRLNQMFASTWWVITGTT